MRDTEQVFMILTPKIEKAIIRSAELHQHQHRKGSGAPYVVHPYSVAFLLAHYTDDEDIICAGLLHDILEDVPTYGAERMQEEFGERVYRIVKEVTEDQDPLEGAPGLSSQDRWKTRKERYIENLKNDSEEALLIACADKIQNLRSLVDSYRLRGEDLWGSFRAEKQEILWFFETVFGVIAARLHHPLVHVFKTALQEAKEKVFFV